MGTHYNHVSDIDRVEIMQLRASGLNFTQIGDHVGKNRRTVSREISRNAAVSGRYSATHAQTLATSRRLGRSHTFIRFPELWERVHAWLKETWSPQQIAGKLRRMKDEGIIDKAVSHETIYSYIYARPRGELRRDLIALLRRSHKNRRKRSGGTNRKGNTIPDAVSIHDRPESVEGRAISGHWEGDLIKGKRNASAVGTVVERKSRLLILVRLDNATSPVVVNGFSREMRRVPEVLRKTFTYDRGSEMTRHADLAAALNIDVYFADPYSPWQRGTNENTNGCVREFLPKGTDLSGVTQEELDIIAERINNRPRKCLGFYSPNEVYEQDVAEAQLIE